MMAQGATTQVSHSGRFAHMAAVAGVRPAGLVWRTVARLNAAQVAVHRQAAGGLARMLLPQVLPHAGEQICRAAAGGRGGMQQASPAAAGPAATALGCAPPRARAA